MFGVPHEDVAVATDAGADGLEEAEAGVCGDGSVGRGASALEDVDGGQGGEGMRGAGGPVAAVDGGARGEAGSVDAVAWVDIGTIEVVRAFGLEFGQ